MRQASLSHFLLGKFLLEHIGRIIYLMKPSKPVILTGGIIIFKESTMARVIML